VLAEVIVMSRIGVLSDLYGRRPALMLAFIVLPIRLLLYVAAPGPDWVAATNLLHGLNFGIVGAVSIAFMNDLAEPGGHGRAQARLAAVLGLATAAGPAVFGALSQQLGMRGMFASAALVGAAGAVAFVLTVEESHPGSKPLSEACPRVLRGACRLLDAKPIWMPGAD
jgi:MFS family permease